MSSVLSKKIQDGIALLPNRPGVYQMKDADDKIIYIGKAKNLKKRVSQYFLRPQSGKVAAMVSHVDHFDFIIVSSDKEAFILEMNMIQTHYPRYNIMLMDDSHYPYIALRRGGDPHLKIARNQTDKKYFYFGPYPSSSSAYQAIDLLNKIYPTRKCRTIPAKPCLYYSLGQCLAPCIKPLEEGKAEELYSSIKRFLGGDVADAKRVIRAKMEEASERMDFEAAAEYKKTLDSIDYVVQKESVELTGDNVSRDVVGFAEREGYLSLSLLTYRRGMLLGKNVHVVPSFGEVEEQIADLLLQYYQTHEAPRQLVCRLPGVKEEIEAIYEEIEVVYPHEGRLVDMIDLASLNARQGLDAHFMSARLSDDNERLLEELGSLLEIKTPYRIELFDNSHLQGSEAVGAMVCYINGEPNKKMYRKYRLSAENAGDDYHSMVEVTSRRYGRIKEEGSSFPDLILTDGGLPQVHATEEGLGKVGVTIPVFGLYKNDRHQTEGLIDSEGKTYPINNKSPLFFLLMRMQDEVHRFAISFHIASRSKAMTNSLFSGIEGIGKKREAKLREHYPSIESLRNASVDELAQLIPLEAAKALHAKLHGDD